MPSRRAQREQVTMTAQQYLKQTDQAAKQLFKALHYYHRMLKGAVAPAFISSTSDDDERGREFQCWHRKNKKRIQIALRKQRKYFGQTISQGAICGSILQIAFMGIKLFSKQETLPVICKGILKNSDAQVAFCVGREVKGLPIGLIIYAARIQYNHMDEDLNNKVAQAVFDVITTHGTGGKYRDPAFDLNNAVLENYSHNIVSLLGWKTYDAYLKDMKDMIA